MYQRKPVQQLSVLPTHKKLLALVEGNILLKDPNSIIDGSMYEVSREPAVE